MHTKTTLVLTLFLTITTFSLTASNSEALYKAARIACIEGDTLALSHYIRDGKIEPPFYLAAKHGHSRIATITAAHKSNVQRRIPQQERQEILFRLITSGNFTNVETYFTHKVIRPRDVTPEILEYAQQRAAIHPANKKILEYLEHHRTQRQQEIEHSLTRQNAKRHARDRKKLSTEETAAKKTAFECSICLDHKHKNMPLRTLRCTHIFHKECVNQWFIAQKNRQVPETCPFCRANIS
jgi:hypothetical protein